MLPSFTVFLTSSEMKKLNRVLLIDDSEDDNFFHMRTLEKQEVALQIDVAYDGEEALEMLTKWRQDGEQIPELIFLDINMPGMDGWEFLATYKDLPAVFQENVVVIMLTTSLNPEDRAKADAVAAVKEFLNKPLDTTRLQDILVRHFDVSSPAS